MLNQASRRLCWLSLLVAVTTVVMFVVQRVIQPESTALHEDPLVALSVPRQPGVLAWRGSTEALSLTGESMSNQRHRRMR